MLSDTVCLLSAEARTDSYLLYSKGVNVNESQGATGFGLGSLIAVVLMWHIHHSVLWCILGAFLNWFYVIYYIIKYGF